MAENERAVPRVVYLDEGMQSSVAKVQKIEIEQSGATAPNTTQVVRDALSAYLALLEKQVERRKAADKVREAATTEGLYTEEEVQG